MVAVHESASDAGASWFPTIEMTLPSLPGIEKVARCAAGVFAEQLGFGSERVEDVKTAVAEACMNAVEHGNGGEVSAEVRVVLRAEAQRLLMLVNDQGKRGLPDPLPEPGYPDRLRGWGLYFIRQLTDEVSFNRLPEGGNQVSMIVHL